MTLDEANKKRCLVLNKSGKPIGIKGIVMTRDFMGYWDDEQEVLLLVKPKDSSHINEGA